MVSTQERVPPKLKDTPAPRERAALGRWSPGSPGRFRRQGLILQAAAAIRRTMIEYFNLQRQWMAVDENWMLAATPGQRRRLKRARRQERRKQLKILLGGIVAWGDWAPNLAAALGPGIGRAMELGANVAQDEVGSFEVDWSLTDPNVANIVRASAFRQAKDIDKITLGRIRGAIGRGLDDGRSTDQIAQSIQNVMSDMSQRRSRLIAQTETIRAQSLGHLQVYEDAGVPAKKWINHRTNFDPICDRLHGQVVGLSENFVDPQTGKTYSGPPAHPGCVVGDTEVVGANIEASLRMFYHGPMLDIETAHGHRLSVTPNHPVLTGRGFVAAQRLNPTDNVVCSHGGDRMAADVMPDDYLMPVLIQDVFEALHETLGMTAVGVPISSEQLHGDALFGQGDINIVGADGFLANSSEIRAEQIAKILFSVSDAYLASFYRLGVTKPLDGFSYSASGGSVGGFSLGLAVLRGELAVSQLIRDGLTAPHTVLAQDAFQDIPSNAEIVGDSLFGFPLDITLDSIRFIREYEFTGHVYDLQTKGHWYSANGIILHNCQCAIRGVVDAPAGADLEVARTS